MTRLLKWTLPLLLAAALRFWSLDFGLEVERVRPDEEFVVGNAVRILESSDPNPHFFHYPSFLMYFDAVLIRVAGPAVDPRLVGRVVSVVCGVGTVLLLGFLGSKMFSARGRLPGCPLHRGRLCARPGVPLRDDRHSVSIPRDGEHRRGGRRPSPAEALALPARDAPRGSRRLDEIPRGSRARSRPLSGCRASGCFTPRESA